jgi:hypothetical protein
MRTVVVGKAGVISFTITSNLQTEFKAFQKDVASFIKAHTDFLTNHKNQIETNTKRIVKKTVYGVPFKPRVYIRTGRLLTSMYAQVTKTSPDHSEMYIDSDASVAPALSARGGYPKYVAGEGDGVAQKGDPFGSGRYKIGFLKTQYGTRKSYFPRPFHTAISDEMPDVLVDMYRKDVLSKI